VSGFIKNIGHKVFCSWFVGHKVKAVFNAIEEGYYDE